MPRGPVRSRAYNRLKREKRFWRSQARLHLRDELLRNADQVSESDSDGEFGGDEAMDDELPREQVAHAQGQPDEPTARAPDSSSEDDMEVRNRVFTLRNMTPMVQPNRPTAEENIRHVVDQHVEQGRDGKYMKLCNLNLQRK